MAAMEPANHTSASSPAKLRIGIILALGFLPALASEPPADLAKRVAQRETESMEARAHYTYRQAVTIEEFPSRGQLGGRYREVRDVIFSPSGERTERFIGRPEENLRRLRLTEEDFQDIREVQPFLFTAAQLWLYETRYRGQERVDGVDCWLLEVSPRQIFHGQRLFDGMFWIDRRDYSVVKSEGVAVPQILNRKQENLFPRFVTWRAKVDGYRFPVRTIADDTLPFTSGPLRMRMEIRYSNYQRFTASSTITFEEGRKKQD